MAPERVTPSVFDNLKWEARDITRVEEELEGYLIIGVEAVTSYRLNSGRDAIDGIDLYLQKPGEAQIKVVDLDADLLSDNERAKLAGDMDPLCIYVATVD